MQDVNRALQSANRAIQTAQEAFQSRRTSRNTNSAHDVVDLTNSPPAPSTNIRTTDSYLTRSLHPQDLRSGNRMANRSSIPSYNSLPRPTVSPFAAGQSMFVEEDDPTSNYAGQSDSLAGPRRRFEGQSQPHRRVRVGFPSLHHIEPTLFRSGRTDARRHEEEEAIRRQRLAREQWERNQQRQRLQQARDRIMASAHRQRSRTEGQSQPSTVPPNNNASSSSMTQHGRSSPVRDTSPGSLSSSSSVKSVDLTSVNNKTDLAAALIHSQASNPTADPTSSSTEPRSALTAYKCPICLEPPRNATTTVCGHLFCHECILETLKNSENMRREDAPPTRKVKGQCPVCRKELARKEEEGTGRTLVPLEIKMISKKKMEELRRQERKRQRGIEKQSKGKGKAKVDQVDDNVFELSSDDEEESRAVGNSQKENTAKRVKLSLSEDLEDDLFGAFVNDAYEQD